MSFNCKLTLFGQEYNVLDARIKFARSVNDKCQPSSKTKGGQAIITVESTGDTKLMGWMCDSYRTEDGKIDWYRIDQESVTKTCDFRNAYCVKYEQNYNSTDKTAMTETFTIAAEEIGMGDALHKNIWGSLASAG